MKKQYTITENNEWELETFSYVMNLTEDEATMIKTKIESIEQCSECLSISQSELSENDLSLINRYFRNSYMDRIGFYEFESGDTLKNWKEFGQLFYKGVGLKRVKYE